MYLYIKVTAWEKRIILNDKLSKEEVIGFLEAGGVDVLGNETNFEYEIDIESIDDLPIEENNNQTTIELWDKAEWDFKRDDKGKLLDMSRNEPVWQNGKNEDE